MIDYLIHNWIDLGILLVLIIMLIDMSRSANIINETLHAIHGKIEEIRLKG